LIIISIKNLLIIVDLPLTIYYVLKRQKKKQYPRDIKLKTITSLVGAFVVLNIMVLLTNKQPALLNQEIYSYHISDVINTHFRKGIKAKEEMETLAAIKERVERE